MIDRGIQPMPFVVHQNHRLIDRDVIRLGVAVGLYAGFLHPVVIGVRLRLTPKLSNIYFVFNIDNTVMWS